MSVKKLRTPDAEEIAAINELAAEMFDDAKTIAEQLGYSWPEPPKPPKKAIDYGSLLDRGIRSLIQSRGWNGRIVIQDDLETMGKVVAIEGCPEPIKIPYRVLMLSIGDSAHEIAVIVRGHLARFHAPKVIAHV